MNTKEKATYRKANQNYLRLNEMQCDMHYDIMMMNTMDEWPQELRDFYTAKVTLYGPAPADVVSCWVADWS